MAKKKQKNKSYWILISFMVVISALAFLYFQFMSSQSNTANLGPSFSPTATPSIETVLSESRDYLQKLFDQKIEYNDTRGSIKYTSNLSEVVDGFQINIKSYKYEKGNTTFTQAYEGSEWIVDLSKEVESFPLIKPGKQTLMTCATQFGCQAAEVEGHKLNKYTWGSVDKYFQPGASWSRTYYTYDRSTQQIIYVNVLVNNVFKNEFFDGIFQTRPEIRTFLDKVEASVLSF